MKYLSPGLLSLIFLSTASASMRIHPPYTIGGVTLSENKVVVFHQLNDTTKDDQIIIDDLDLDIDEEALEALENEIENEIHQSRSGDTLSILFGKKGLKVIKKDDEVEVDVLDRDDFKEGMDKKEKDRRPPRKDFEGHWASVGLAINNYVDKDFSLSRTASNQFMDLNTSRSLNFSLYLFEYSLGFTRNSGLVTGLGIEWHNYFFDGNNSIRENPSTGNIESELLLPENLKKTKLVSSYLTVPLLFEVQFTDHDGPFINFGVVGGLKTGSHTKYVYKDDGDKDKIKNHDDFNLAPFRYGLYASMGIEDVKIFGSYYMNPLFEKGKGPELYPVNVGLALNF
jgi:hypothetical protein